MKTRTQPRPAPAALGCAFVALAVYALVPSPLHAQAVVQVPPTPPPTAAVAAPPAPTNAESGVTPEPVTQIEAPPAAPAPAPLTTSAQAHRLPAYLLWGAGGVSLVAGVIVGVTALSAKSAYNDNPTFAAADRAEGRANTADILLGLGLVLATTGTVFYFTAGAAADQEHARLPDAGRASLQLAPMIGPKAGGAVAALRF